VLKKLPIENYRNLSDLWRMPMQSSHCHDRNAMKIIWIGVRMWKLWPKTQLMF